MTVVEINAYLTELKTAYNAAISGKSYTIGSGGNSRSYTRQDLQQLRGEISYWEGEKAKLDSGRTGIPTKFLTGHKQ